MPERYRTRKFPAPLRRALDVAAAIATEEIMALHVAQALELVELGDGRVAPARMADIYLRLHGVVDPTAGVVRTRVLAQLGQRERVAPDAELPGDEDGTAEAPRGPFRTLRERFRGRIHADLRRWTELHIGRCELQILAVHVRNALVFVRTLAPSVPIAEAVAIYREKVGVREQLAEMLYWSVLARLSEEELPLAEPVPESEGEDLRIPPTPRKGTRRNGTVRTPYRTI